MRRFALAALCALVFCSTTAHARRDLRGAVRTDPGPGVGDYVAPFYPDGTWLGDIDSPSDFLGRELGAWPATNEEIIAYYEYLADHSDRATLYDYGRTYEGRRLIYLVVASDDHSARLGQIRDGLGKLADPRGVSGGDATEILESFPAVAWMGYGIHGDELSSCDAALQLAWQLVAGTDDTTQRIRDNVITIIDPSQNPDGRTRWLGMMEQYNSVIPSPDIQSLQHRGSWPQGRTNHYLFDLNRDWFSLVHPETRGKVAVLLEWMPHYVLDCHEMGPTDTYLFSPPREPFNPYMADYIYKWWNRVAEDEAAAFDRYGWSYYTREWNEEFFPGYGSSWGIYLGAVGMLFEQAGVDGSRVKRPEGTIMTYRETVHHQFVGSFSNLLTVAEHRRELLEDYYAVKRGNVRGRDGAFVVPPSPNMARFERFAETLTLQGIEVERATEDFRAKGATSWTGDRAGSMTYPEGSLIVRTNQPLRQLVEAILTFDIRIPTAFLETERRNLLKHRRTRLYDTTGWSLPHAYGLESYYLGDLPAVKTQAYRLPEPAGGLSGDESAVAFVFGSSDDRSYRLLGALLERGWQVRSSRVEFSVGGRDYPRGSFLVRVNDNPDMDTAALRDLAREAGADVAGVSTQLAMDSADLGGDEFRLLERPRIAVVGGDPIAYYHFGATWHLLDARLGIRVSTLDVSRLRVTDLDKYNVLVLPHSWGGAMDYKRRLGDDGIARLRDWIRDGGTLVVEGNAAAFAADTSVALTSVRMRRQMLDRLEVYQDALAAERDAETEDLDSLEVWQPERRPAEEAKNAGDKKASPSSEIAKKADERARRLFPRGSILAADTDEEHWLTVGCGPMVPVMFNTSYAYLAPDNVSVAARLAPYGRVRLAGLMWPEARERWADTVWAARERVGDGQVILFATMPNFRGYFYGAERMLLNALLLGPGLGASQTIEW